MKRQEERVVKSISYSCDVCGDIANWHSERDGSDYCYVHAIDRIEPGADLTDYFVRVEKEIID